MQDESIFVIKYVSLIKLLFVWLNKFWLNYPKSPLTLDQIKVNPWTLIFFILIP